eukprot:TRINITY_DN601_c0_g3_i1.p1 TRINITY_DN601_c0_g3~~TRINITY_DN601_c0_g3_i1.p1  ORF type:complete len:429 (-),score=112.74 TRINITY_DN601_c0_g3_i1:21-1307(-)
MALGFLSLFEALGYLVHTTTFILKSVYRTSFSFSFGFERLEVLASFSRTIFFMFLCLFVVFETMEELLEATEIYSGYVLLVVSLNIMANVAIVLVGEGSRDDKKQDISHRALQDNIPQLILFVTTFISSLFGWTIFDPFVGVLIAATGLWVALPIAKDTARILLQGTPKESKEQLYRALEDIKYSLSSSVVDVKNEHFWTPSPGKTIGSMLVIIKDDASEQYVLEKVINKFSVLLSSVVVQIEKQGYYSHSHQNGGCDHDHEDGHGHSHSHSHGHDSHEHNHGHSHDSHDSHGHSHDSHDNHDHDHDHDHDHGHGHGHGHGHDHGHGHSHGHHEDDHNHSHSHSHSHNSKSHKHKHDDTTVPESRQPASFSKEGHGPPLSASPAAEPSASQFKHHHHQQHTFSAAEDPLMSFQPFSSSLLSNSSTKKL